MMPLENLGQALSTHLYNLGIHYLFIHPISVCDLHNIGICSVAFERDLQKASS